MVVAEIDADRIAGKHDQIPCNERLLAGLVFSRPSPSHSRDHACSGIVTTASVGLGVGDIHDVIGVEGYGSRLGEIDLEGWTISVEYMLSDTDDSGDDAGLMVHFSDTVTAGVADIKIIAGIKRDVERQIESGFPTEAFVAAIARFSDTGKIMERAFLKIHSSDTIGPGFGKIEPYLIPIECGMMGQRNPRLDCTLSITGTPGLPVPCERFNIADRKLKLGLHIPVALFRLVSRVKQSEPAQPAVPRRPLPSPWGPKSSAAERPPSSARSLGLRLQSRPPHVRTS